MVEELLGGFMDQTSNLVRNEVDYITSSVKSSIENGIKEGFDAVRKVVFYLFVALGATLIGMVFLIWGLAKVSGELFGSEGAGFMVLGAAALLVGFLSFSMSKPK